MTKVFLFVVIAYVNQPSKSYHQEMKGIDECRATEAELYQTIPSDNVEKYIIGCSFEEPAPQYPL